MTNNLFRTALVAGLAVSALTLAACQKKEEAPAADAAPADAAADAAMPAADAAAPAADAAALAADAAAPAADAAAAAEAPAKE